MNYGKLTAGTTKTAIDTAKPSEKGEIITYLSRMGDVLHNVPERRQIIFASVAVNTIRYRNEPHIMVRKEFLQQFSHTQKVTSQTGGVLDEHRTDFPSLNIFEHRSETRTVHAGTADAVICIMQDVGIPFFARFPLQQNLLRLNAVTFTLRPIITGDTLIAGPGSLPVRMRLSLFHRFLCHISSPSFRQFCSPPGMALRISSIYACIPCKNAAIESFPKMAWM